LCIIDDRSLVYCKVVDTSQDPQSSTDSETHFSPVPISGEPITSVSVGDFISCVLTDSGSVSCWENNLSRDGSFHPFEVINGRDSSAISVISGDEKSCAILVDRSVVCWDHNSIYLEDSNEIRPEIILEGPMFPVPSSSIAIGGNFLCSVGMDKEVLCSGDISFGEETNSTTESGYYSIVFNDSKPISISASDSQICVTESRGRLVCVGENIMIESDENDFLPTISLEENLACFVKSGWFRITCVHAGELEILYTDLGRAKISSMDSDKDGISNQFDDFPYDESASVICNPGSFGEHFCNPVPPGFFVNLTGSKVYWPCPAGSFQDNHGSIDCKTSPPGSYSPVEGSHTPKYCEAGSFSTSIGAVEDTCIPVSPGNWSLAASLSQIRCPSGQYQPLSGQSTCIYSSPGHYVPVKGSVSQIPCEPGTFQDENKSDICKTSSPGHYVDANESTTQTPCPPGTYNPEAGSISEGDCSPSPPGSYVDAIGAASYTPCPGGTFSDLTAQDSPETCEPSPPGSFSLPGSPSPTPCPPGEFQPEEGQESCLLAEIGFFSSVHGSIEQTQCLPGTYQNSSGSSLCIESSPGEFVQTGSPHAVEPCSPGFFQPNSRQVDCAPSSPGFYVDPLNPILEIPCPEGQFQPNYSSMSCLLSPPGFFISVFPATEPSMCEPGEYQPNSSAMSCIRASPGYHVPDYASEVQYPCPVGMFQPKQSSTDCVAASVGNFSSILGSAIQFECPLGYFQNQSGQSSCIPSPEGFYSDQKGMSKPNKCPGNGSNNGTGNKNYWSCMDSDNDGDGIIDNVDEFPHLGVEIRPFHSSLIWLLFSSVFAIGINKSEISGDDVEEG